MDAFGKQLCLYFITGFSVFYAVMAITETREKNKLEQRKREDLRSAEVISIEGGSVLLDTNGNPKTAEAKCSFSETDLKKEDIQRLFPKGTTRSIWEWEHMGQYSKIKGR